MSCVHIGDQCACIRCVQGGRINCAGGRPVTDATTFTGPQCGSCGGHPGCSRRIRSTPWHQPEQQRCAQDQDESRNGVVERRTKRLRETQAVDDCWRRHAHSIEAGIHKPPLGNEFRSCYRSNSIKWSIDESIARSHRLLCTLLRMPKQTPVANHKNKN